MAIMTIKINEKLKFTKRIRVSGNLSSNYVFQDEAAVKHWKETQLPELEKVYGKLTIAISELPGFVVGDKCKVHGEGSEILVIEGLFQYSKDRYGFNLDSGWNEEVAKCYK